MVLGRDVDNCQWVASITGCRKDIEGNEVELHDEPGLSSKLRFECKDV